MTTARSPENMFELLESLSEWAWQHNLETDEISASDNFWSALGYEPDAVPLTLGAAEKIIHPLDSILVAEEFELVRRFGEPFEMEYRLRAANGEWRFLRLRGSVFETDDKGEPLVVGGIVQDITAQVVAARAHRQAEELVATLSKREHEVVSCLVAGAASKNIAYGLGLSQRTVEGYRARVMEKLGVRGVGDLVQLAVEGGISAESAVDCGLAPKRNQSGRSARARA